MSCTIGCSGVRARGVAAKPVKPRIIKDRRKELRSALRNAPELRLHFVEMDDIPFVPESEILQNAGRGKSDRDIDWCA